MLIVLCVWTCFHTVSRHDFVYCPSAAFTDGKPQHTGDLLPAVYQCCNTRYIIKLHAGKCLIFLSVMHASYPEKTV